MKRKREINEEKERMVEKQTKKKERMDEKERCNLHMNTQTNTPW